MGETEQHQSRQKELPYVPFEYKIMPVQNEMFYSTDTWIH
jgi:hypothetical protein